VNKRKLLITLLIIVLLVVYYLLGTDYLRQLEQHESLPQQIAEVNRNRAQIPARPADLEEQMAAVQAELDTVGNTLPEKLNSTRIINTILRLAEDIGVKAIPLVTQPWTNKGSDNYTYSVFRLNVAVTGTFTELVTFLSRLENGELQTLVMENLSVSRADEQSGEEATPGNTTGINASLDIAIYSQSRATGPKGKVY
jgi:Tfp pilus assembly protein PilO